MRYFLACFLLTSHICFAQTGNDLFTALDQEIKKAAQYDRQKEAQINALRSRADKGSLQAQLKTAGDLYEAYKVFNYDSAYFYAEQGLNLAYQLQDPVEINCGRIKLSFVLMSAGLFKEANDTLSVITHGQLSQNCKRDYYTLRARYHYDLADYSMDRYHTPRYNQIGNSYIDSALLLLPGGFESTYYSGLKEIRSGNIDAASVYLKKLVTDSRLSLHQQALAKSTMSDIYIQKGFPDSAIRLLVEAAIADIRSSTKETSAIFNLSNILFQRGDLKNASAYIEKAVKDAVFYGARQRKVQMSALLPLIEGEKIARVEGEKRTVVTYAIIVTLLLILLIYLTFLVFRQVRKLRKAQAEITAAHIKQQEINGRLIEANKIKEEYIGFFFTANTSFYDKLERFKKKAQQKVVEKKTNDIEFLLGTLNIKEEREELLDNFDRIFLKLFPRFIESFNALFEEEEKVRLKENQLLNTELRIFALIRMGIHDNDKIAHILGYSVNTINAYKTRVKNRSSVPNDQFEDAIMSIPSV